MSISQKSIAELELLLKFPTHSSMQGIKVHHDAPSQLVSAAQSLFDKGVITQNDGGYLTELGHELQQRAIGLFEVLNAG